MKRESYVVGQAVIAAVMILDSMYSADGEQREATSAEMLRDAAEMIRSQCSPAAICKLSSLLGRALEKDR